MKAILLFCWGALLLSTCGQQGVQTAAAAAPVEVATATGEAPAAIAPAAPAATTPATPATTNAPTPAPTPVELIQEASDGSDAVLEWDKTVHDFGDISVSDGPQTCTFTLTNKGQEPIAIYEVVSSCGCTDVKWTRELLQPGQSGTISATYKNSDGPLPFDKTLTVYISGVKRPVILRLRGVVHEKKKSLSELYGKQQLGDLGLKTLHYKTGTLRQGLSASETATVANLGRKAIDVQFTDVSPGLSVSVSPNPIPAGSTATLAITVTAQPETYGRTIYTARPVINGKNAGEMLDVTAWTQENFSSWTERERAEAAVPVFENSTVSFGTASVGEKLELSFLCTNRGKQPLKFYKADTEIPALSVQEPLPVIGADEKGSLRVTLETSSLEKGETVLMISLTTNSPLRPQVNLFVAGELR